MLCSGKVTDLRFYHWRGGWFCSYFSCINNFLYFCSLCSTFPFHMMKKYKKNPYDNRVSNVLAGPRCNTVYEDECSTVEEEECNTVSDEICEVTNEEKCETVQDRRCSVTYSKSCSPNKEQKCGSVTDTINEQTCQSNTERKCSTVRHPVCHVMKVSTMKYFYSEWVLGFLKR